MIVPSEDKLQDLWIYKRVNQYFDENRPAPDHSLFIAEFKEAIDKIKADAWDEGFQLGDGVGTYSRAERDQFNPYRKQGKHEQQI